MPQLLEVCSLGRVSQPTQFRSGASCGLSYTNLSLCYTQYGQLGIGSGTFGTKLVNKSNEEHWFFCVLSEIADSSWSLLPSVAFLLARLQIDFVGCGNWKGCALRSGQRAGVQRSVDRTDGRASGCCSTAVATARRGSGACCGSHRRLRQQAGCKQATGGIGVPIKGSWGSNTAPERAGPKGEGKVKEAKGTKQPFTVEVRGRDGASAVV